MSRKIVIRYSYWLPDDIWLRILCQLPFESRCKIILTNKLFYKLFYKLFTSNTMRNLSNWIINTEKYSNIKAQELSSLKNILKGATDLTVSYRYNRSKIGQFIDTKVISRLTRIERLTLIRCVNIDIYYCDNLTSLKHLTLKSDGKEHGNGKCNMTMIHPCPFINLISLYCYIK